MLKRIAVVGVPAQNVARAVHFYRDVLGLRLLPQHDGAPHFRLDNLFLAVFERGASDIRSETPLAAFEVDGLEEVMSALIAHGVAFEGNLHDEGTARWVAFRDSEGNRLELVEFSSGDK